MKIIDFSRYMPGPLASRILIDLGAEVTKVENPKGGDANRGAPPYVKGEAIFHVALNAGARSIALSPRDPRWPPLVRGLVESADAVIVSGLEPGLEKIGLSYAQLTDVNPRLVWCNVTGYGEVGPWKDLPSHGLNPDAFAGLVPLEWTDGVPDPYAEYQSAGAPLSAVFLALGLMAGLRRRDETGAPQRVHTSMFGSAIWWNWRHNVTYINNGEPWWKYKDFGARYATYRCSDGRVILVCPIEKHFWQRFCTLLDLPEAWMERGTWDRTVMDHGYNYTDEREVIAERMARETADHWIGALMEINIPFAPILTPIEAMTSPHAEENAVMRDISVGSETARIPSMPLHLGEPGTSSPRLRTPDLGEHGAEILTELGLPTD